MSLKKRVKRLKDQLSGGTELWTGCNSLAQFGYETWGDHPPTPGTRRLQLAICLRAVPIMLASDDPEGGREECLRLTGLTPEQADNEAEVDKFLLETATSADFTEPELKALWRWVAEARANVKKWYSRAGKSGSE